MRGNTPRNISAVIAHARFAKGMGHNEDLFPFPARHCKRSGPLETMPSSFAGTMAIARGSTPTIIFGPSALVQCAKTAKPFPADPRRGFAPSRANFLLPLLLYGCVHER